MFHDDKNPLEPEYTPFPQTQEERFSGFYETGNIRPPKNHGGWVAAVLLTCIFLGGLAGGAILINLSEHMQQETPGTSQEPTTPVTLAETQASEPAETGQPILQATGPHGDDAELIISSTSEATPNIPQSGGLSLQEIYRKVSPSVVSITSRQANSTAYGSGIIMSQSGYIITNCHVVSEAYHLSVTLSDGQTYDAQLVGKDSVSDLAVLHVDATGLTVAEFGDSSQAQVGDAVVAIGDPMGVELRGTMTDGIISAINRNLTIQGHELTLIQTTAALNKGNSGGPLINCYGQVIGINTAKIGDYYSSAGVEGLGFAIPVHIAKDVVDQLIETGYIPGRPSLGVETVVLDLQDRLYFNLPDGLYITSVDENSNSWAVGIRPRDLLIRVGGQSVTSQEELSAALSSFSVGDTVNVIIYRSGRQLTADIVLQEATQ